MMLRRQVLGGAHDLAGGGQGYLVSQAGDTEVGDLHPLVRSDNQVAGLHVAVHETLGVGCCQGTGGLRHDIEDAVSR